MLVTLIGERQVKEGNEFIYLGPLTECRDCKLKVVCFNLEEGRKYKIKSARGVRHDCRVYDEGVRVVEVEPTSLDVSANDKGAIEGSTMTFEAYPCEDVGCKWFRLCHPAALKSGSKVKILKVGGDIDCQKGYELRQVTVE